MSFSLRSVAAGLVLVTASLLSGCGGGSGKPAPGMGCALNSECAAGLICTFGLLSQPVREGRRLHARDVREVDRASATPAERSTSASSPRRLTATTTATARRRSCAVATSSVATSARATWTASPGQVCTTSGVCADQSQIVAGTNDVKLVTTGRDGGFDAFASGTAGTGVTAHRRRRRRGDRDRRSARAAADRHRHRRDRGRRRVDRPGRVDRQGRRDRERAARPARAEAAARPAASASSASRAPVRPAASPERPAAGPAPPRPATRT